MIDYTAEQRARAVELWQRILDYRDAYLTELWPTGYGSYGETNIDAVSPEWLAALVDSDGAGTDEHNPVTVTLVSYSDYGGSDCDAANVRALDGTPGVTTSTGGYHGEGTATVQLGELPGGEDESIDDGLDRLEHVADLMAGLEDYPLIDEEIHSEYQTELEDEAWDAWLRDDVIGDLDRVAPHEWEITDGVEAELRTAYYAYELSEWVCESATSVHNYRHDDALAHAALTVLGWDYPKLEAKRKAREEKLREAQDKREARWQREKDNFRVIWRAFLDDNPIPGLINSGDYTMRTAYNIMAARHALPATVAGVLAMVRDQAEDAAYRDAERRTMRAAS